MNLCVDSCINKKKGLLLHLEKNRNKNDRSNHWNEHLFSSPFFIHSIFILRSVWFWSSYFIEKVVKNKRRLCNHNSIITVFFAILIGIDNLSRSCSQWLIWIDVEVVIDSKKFVMGLWTTTSKKCWSTHSLRMCLWFVGHLTCCSTSVFKKRLIRINQEIIIYLNESLYP